MLALVILDIAQSLAFYEDIKSAVHLESLIKMSLAFSKKSSIADNKRNPRTLLQPNPHNKDSPDQSCRARPLENPYGAIQNMAP